MKKNASILKNEFGGVYVLTMMAAASIAGSFLYVKNHFDKKIEKVNLAITDENAQNLNRELKEALSDPRTCLATLGDNYSVRPDSVQEEYIPLEKFDQNQNNNFIDNIGLVSTTGEKIDSVINEHVTGQPPAPPSPKFLNDPDLKIRNIQVVYPDSIDPALDTQSVRASLYVTYSSYQKGELGKTFPAHKQDMYLRLKKQGTSHVVIGCIPQRPPEMEPLNYISFKRDIRGDERIQISKDGHSRFKLCTMSGFKFKPDLNNINTAKFKGQIAGRAPSECLLYPIDSLGNRMNPKNITYPVRWMMSMNADIDYDFLGMQWIEIKSDIMCEAICF